MSCRESSSAVSEAFGSRGDGARTPTVESQGLPHCRLVAGGAVSGANQQGRAGCAGRTRPERDGGAARPVGILEVLPAAARSRPPMEP